MSSTDLAVLAALVTALTELPCTWAASWGGLEFGVDLWSIF